LSSRFERLLGDNFLQVLRTGSPARVGLPHANFSSPVTK
jgi:hypothetical protein